MTVATLVNLAAGALLLGAVAFAMLLLALLGALVFRRTYDHGIDPLKNATKKQRRVGRNGAESPGPQTRS